jgi:hypothetical protein
MRNKKSQFYLFTAIVLIAYSTLLLQSASVVPESSKTFRMAFNNFVFESDAALNNALFEQADMDQEYDRFLDSFISYSKMKKLNIEIFSVLEHQDRVYLFNKMDNPVHIINLNQTVPAGTDTYLARSNISALALEVRDDVFHENIYKFSISEQATGSKAVLRVKKGSRREIFVKD